MTSHYATRNIPGKYTDYSVRNHRSSCKIWAIRIRLQLASRTRDLALFNLAINSKLQGCDLVSLHVRDVCNGAEVL
jgi:hypothetical protein